MIPTDAEMIDMDDEANIFAMHLLMPTPLLRKELKGRGVAIDDDKAVAKLAAKFKVPASIMALRLGMLVQERASTLPPGVKNEPA